MSPSMPVNFSNLNKTEPKEPISPYIYHPIAAALAIIPLAKGLIRKSELQIGNPKQKLGLTKVIFTGLKIAPIVGITVGSQMILEDILKKKITNQKEEKKLSSNLKISAIVGFATSPLIAIFNAQAMNLGLTKALKTLSLRQISLISFQESSFVAGMSCSEFLPSFQTESNALKSSEKIFKLFFSSFVGAFFGHIPNTILTRSQNGLKTNKLSMLLKGSFTRSFTIGSFSVIYHAIKYQLAGINK
jgi:hypothetical protein